MPLDPKIIREAQAAYRQWNEAELRERLHAADKPSTQETWRQYVALVEFCWKLAPEPSEWQHAQKQEALAQYYERIQKFEAWRQLRGKRA
jgi:ABC-type branched-subunit amino acid transport system substrate-binding protein